MTESIPSRRVRACILIDPHDGHVRSTGSWCPGVDEDDETGMHDPESPDFDPDVRDQDIEREALSRQPLDLDAPSPWAPGLTNRQATRLTDLRECLGRQGIDALSPRESAERDELEALLFVGRLDVARDETADHLRARIAELEAALSDGGAVAKLERVLQARITELEAELDELAARAREIEQDAARDNTVSSRALAGASARITELEKRLAQNQQDYRVAREWITELEDQPLRTQLRERDAQLAEALAVLLDPRGNVDRPADLREILTRHLP